MPNPVNSPLDISAHNNLTEQLRIIYDRREQDIGPIVARYNRLLDLFRERFSNAAPVFVVRAPGRVNLIGEHTDYNGYPVLPVAIDRDIVLIFTPTSDKSVQVANENPLFEPRIFPAELPMTPFVQGDWGNYVKAAIGGLLGDGVVGGKSAVGFRGLVGGNLPESSGLSSSSALTVASALAFLVVNRQMPERIGLAETLARAERFVGMEGGGMDQAVSLLGESGAALKIDFFPLRVRSVPLPPNLVFVICNSLVRATKSSMARDAYNRRVVECRLAAALLSKAISEKTGRNARTTVLADLAPDRLDIQATEVDRIAAHAIGERPLSLAEAARRLDEFPSDVLRKYCTLKDGQTQGEPPDGFKVWVRYRHVVSEARRVERAVVALQQADAHEFGRLMNESHASCRDDYEVSCAELEELVSIARRHGAIGARLTGAGFGGCTVNAVPLDLTKRFITGVNREYYDGYVKKRAQEQFTHKGNIQDALFYCRAVQGAGVVHQV